MYGRERGERNISPLKTHLRLRDGSSRSHVPCECRVGELLFGKGTPHLHTTVLIPRIQIGYESQNTTTPSRTAANQPASHTIISMQCGIEMH